ncbi:hypothetical protein VaNZ11_002581 [Volvox africanus]|uniref:HIT-type domain-containing protein n=1 Tax=Volvox africanus TaxID=51714 RepID=A0ABQ5RSZ1_9CHLO|nr:hypothetical protein VaNZ11_002581 [Volvox africanus]
MDTKAVAAAAPMPVLPCQKAACTSTPSSFSGHKPESVVQGAAGEEEQEERPSAPLCEHCGAAPSKYRCPGCQRRSCSLECVRAHKASSGCSGQRVRTAFVSMQEFDDRALMSDFRLLEEIGRADDVARRCRPPAPKQQLPPHLGSLVYQASQRSVKLLLMPPGMAKRTSNTTRFDSRKRTMFWRVEWRFPEANIHCVNERVDEKSNLGEVLSAHLRHPAPNYIPLRRYAKAGLDQLRVFMRKEKTPANQAAFFPIDITRPLASQLESKTLIEYPVFIVALPHEVGLYPPPAMIAPPPRQLKPPPAEAVQDAAQDGDVDGSGTAAAAAADVHSPALAGEVIIGVRPAGQWAVKGSNASSADGAGAPCGSPVPAAAGSRREVPSVPSVQLQPQRPHPLSDHATAVVAASTSAAAGAVAVVASKFAGTGPKGSSPAKSLYLGGGGGGLGWPSSSGSGSGSGDTAEGPPFKRQRVAVEAAGGTGSVCTQPPGSGTGSEIRMGPVPGLAKAGSTPFRTVSVAAAAAGGLGRKEGEASRDENEIELADEDENEGHAMGDPGHGADLAGVGARAAPAEEGAEAVRSGNSERGDSGGGGQGAGHAPAAAAAAATAAEGGDARSIAAVGGGGGTVAGSVVKDYNEIALDDELEA